MGCPEAHGGWTSTCVMCQCPEEHREACCETHCNLCQDPDRCPAKKKKIKTIVLDNEATS